MEFDLMVVQIPEETAVKLIPELKDKEWQPCDRGEHSGIPLCSGLQSTRAIDNDQDRSRRDTNREGYHLGALGDRK